MLVKNKKETTVQAASFLSRFGDKSLTIKINRVWERKLRKPFRYSRF